MFLKKLISYRVFINIMDIKSINRFFSGLTIIVSLFFSTQVLAVFPPNNLSAPGSSSTDSFTVTWDEIPSNQDCISYNVRIVKPNSQVDSERVSNCSNTSLQYVASLEGEYQISIRAYFQWLEEDDDADDSAWSEYSTPIMIVVSPIPDTPTIKNNPINSASASVEYFISWPSVEGADYYQLAEKINNGSWVYAKYSTSPGSGNTEIEFIGQANGTYSYQVRACNSNGCSAYSSIKAIVVSAPIPETVSLPYSESFESGVGGWENANSKTWRHDGFGTTSGGTGPSTAKDGSYYMYMETSNGGAYTAGDTAILLSPSFNAANASISFNYHMYGSNMGALYLEIYSNGQWNNIWNRSGQQHSSNSASWASANVSLATYSGILQLRFRGVAVGSYRGDMAIDNIKISNIEQNQGNRKVIFIHTDLLGSPAAETDISGTIQGGQ